MDKVNQAVLDLLLDSIDWTPCGEIWLSADGWRAVYSQAMRQGVCGLVWSAAMKKGVGVPEDLAVQWENVVGVIRRDNERINHIIGLQRAAWERESVNAVLLKGPESAKMYPDPGIRMGGDIDWWMVTDADWTRALEYVRAKGIGFRTDSDGDVHYEFGGVMIEHHRGGLACEGPLGELLLRCEHVLHHAMVFGVGLKQVCDYLAALKFYEGKYDESEYAALLRSRGLARWEKALRGLNPAFVKIVFSDGNMGLDRKCRWRGLPGRLLFFLRICPVALCKRWCGLIIGRIKNHFITGSKKYSLN